MLKRKTIANKCFFFIELDVLCRLPHLIPISAFHEWNLDGLIELIWKYLNLIRIYTKPRVQT
jgi:uncharacterized protein